MRKLTLPFLTLLLLVVPIAALGDSSYEHTSQVTGGQFIDTLKNLPMISKQMKQLTEPTSEITMVHGNQKAVVSRDSTEITDLDKEVIIRIDNVKKTYTVMTFADMRKMIADMPARMAQMQQQMKDAQAKAQQQSQAGQTAPPNIQTSFTAAVSEPGVTKDINGKSATQHILTLKMTVTDTNNPGTTINYTTTTEIWTTLEVPAEMKAVQDFDLRFAQKLMAGEDMSAMMGQMKAMRDSSAGAMAMMFGNKPGAADAFAQMQKEMQKIKGTRILEITRMGGTGTGIQAQPAPAATAGTNGTPAQNGNGSVAGQVASDTATNTASGESSRFGIPGQALTGALIGAFHRKKSTPPPAAAAPAQAQPAQTATAAQTSTDVTLMEMTSQTHNFSTETIPASVFQIPAGYKQVQIPMQ